MHRCCVYHTSYASVHWLYIILCFWKVYVCFLSLIHYTLFSVSRLVGAVCRKRTMEANDKQRGKQIANINLPKPNSVHICDVSSAVHIHVIRIALEARQATALHIQTTIICGVVLAVRRLRPERSKGKTNAYAIVS